MTGKETVVACATESLKNSPEKTKRHTGGRESEVKPSTSYIPVVQITVLLKSVVQEVFLCSIVAYIGKNQDKFCPNDACMKPNFHFF
jgi:hypothetical protein